MEDSGKNETSQGAHVDAEAVVRDSHFLRGRKRSHLITDAKLGPGQDRRRREIEYAILQGLRIPSLVFCCIFLALHWWVAAAIVVAITVPLPWIAVVLGNSKGQVRDERERMTYRPALIRQQQQAAEAQAIAREQDAARRAQLGYDPETTIDHEPDSSPEE